MKKCFSLIELSTVLLLIIILSGVTYVTFYQSKDDTKYNLMKSTFQQLAEFQKNFYNSNTDFATSGNVIESYLGKGDGEKLEITSLPLSSNSDLNKISISKNVSSTFAKFGATTYDGSYCYRLLLNFDITNKEWSESISRTTTLTCSGDNVVL